MKKGMAAVIAGLTGGLAGAAATAHVSGKKTTEMQNLSNKHLALFLLMNQWVKVKQEGKNLSVYFEEKGYKSIAVYGMSYVGETLVDELRETKTRVVYGIDQRADYLYSDVEIKTLDDNLENVDAVVVTAITYFDEIEEKLCDMFDCPILSLEDILHEV